MMRSRSITNPSKSRPSTCSHIAPARIWDHTGRWRKEKERVADDEGKQHHCFSYVKEYLRWDIMKIRLTLKYIKANLT